MIIATCGHEISTKWMMSGKGDINVKDFDREGNRVISHLVICPKCLRRHRKYDHIAETKKDEENWFKGNKK